ncbi:hypothetical protein Tco_0620679 [Tanacetum coccineum]
MSIYLKHMGGYKHNQLKGRSYDEIQKLFDKEMKRVNSFVAMNSEAQESSGKKYESSTKRAGDELEQEHSKKQKTDETEEVQSDDEAEVKKHMEIVKDDDIAIDAIPLASKPPMNLMLYHLLPTSVIILEDSILEQTSLEEDCWDLRLQMILRVTAASVLLVLPVQKFLLLNYNVRRIATVRR